MTNNQRPYRLTAKRSIDRCAVGELAERRHLAVPQREDHHEVRVERPAGRLRDGAIVADRHDRVALRDELALLELLELLGLRDPREELGHRRLAGALARERHVA